MRVGINMKRKFDANCQQRQSKLNKVISRRNQNYAVGAMRRRQFMYIVFGSAQV